MKYRDELTRAMTWLGSQSDTVFIGQAVASPGTSMTGTLIDVPDNKKIEMPVSEEMQMGITIGMAVDGSVPVSIYPRWNFLLLATNQLVNHLDKLQAFSAGRYAPKCIIRVGIGSERPLHPQHQHIGDFTDAYRMMLTNTDIIRLDTPEQIFDAYKTAYERQDGKSTVLVEWGDFHNEK
jgi:pyruvate/2-oxoglutarate/acetoin dehydrogenase E1 component